jgi:hypothetical protein
MIDSVKTICNLSEFIGFDILYESTNGIGVGRVDGAGSVKRKVIYADEVND